MNHLLGEGGLMGQRRVASLACVAKKLTSSFLEFLLLSGTPLGIADCADVKLNHTVRLLYKNSLL